MNKKAAEMTIGTIIIIILALVVLVVLIYGFTTGWGNLWENILGFGGGKVNVQTVVQSCQIACGTNSQYNYCEKKSDVVFEEDQPAVKDLTCFKLARDYPQSGLTCDTITNCIVVPSEEQTNNEDSEETE